MSLNDKSDFERLPHRYRLISPDGYAAGTYDTAAEAASAAGGFWPGVGQDDTNSGFGWDIEVVGADQ